MRRMCTFSDAVWERGKNEGILSNSIKNIQNLIQNHVVSSIEEAMDLLGVEASLRPSILNRYRYIRNQYSIYHLENGYY